MSNRGQKFNLYLFFVALSKLRLKRARFLRGLAKAGCEAWIIRLVRGRISLVVYSSQAHSLGCRS